MERCFSHHKMDHYELISHAPNQFKTRDTGGYSVLQATQSHTDGTNYDRVKYYRGNAYILPDDHASSHGTKDKFNDLLKKRFSF